MYIGLDLGSIDLGNIIITDAMHNTVIENSNFMRVMYSEDDVAFNGLYINCDFSDSTIERYFQKYKCVFNQLSNKALVDRMARFESDILAAAAIPNKRRRHGLAAQLSSGFVKIFTDGERTPEDATMILKISGVWEAEEEYGITYKFLISNRQL